MPARALDPALLSAAAWPRLVERVVAPAFHFVELPDLGEGDGFAAPFTLLPGALDEPLVWVRGAGGPGLLSNACTHRGHLVVTAAGPCKALRCGYHGRRFELDGRLKASPGFGPLLGHDLPAPPRFSLGPMSFVSVDRAAQPPAGLLSRLGGLPLERAKPDGGRDFVVKAHFLLWLENFLEGFHIPFVHPGLATALDLGAYRTDLLPWGSVQIGIGEAGAPEVPLPVDHPDRRPGEGPIVGYYLHLFPFVALNVYPWGVSLNAVVPVSPVETIIRYRFYTWEPALKGQGAGGDLFTVEAEDDAVVERTAQGLRSRLYRPGLLSAEEPGVAHLHALLGAAIGDAGL
jgi:choline monooxygenase